MRTSCETMNITGKNPSATPRKALLSMIRCGHQVEILDRRRRDSHDRTRVVFALGVRPRRFHHCRHLVFLVYRPDRPYHGRRGIAHRFPHSECGPACVALPCINGVGERNARSAAAHPLRTCATHRRPARPACLRSSWRADASNDARIKTPRLSAACTAGRKRDVRVFSIARARYTIPCAIMASASLVKPAMFAPTT